MSPKNKKKPGKSNAQQQLVSDIYELPDENIGMIHRVNAATGQQLLYADPNAQLQDHKATSVAPLQRQPRPAEISPPTMDHQANIDRHPLMKPKVNDDQWLKTFTAPFCPEDRERLFHQSKRATTVSKLDAAHPIYPPHLSPGGAIRHLEPGWFDENPKNKLWRECKNCNPFVLALEEDPTTWTIRTSSYSPYTAARFLELDADPPIHQQARLRRYYDNPPNSSWATAKSLTTDNTQYCVLMKDLAIAFHMSIDGHIANPYHHHRLLIRLQAEFFKLGLFVTPLELAIQIRTDEGQFEFVPMSLFHFKADTVVVGHQCHKFICPLKVISQRPWNEQQIEEYRENFRSQTPPPRRPIMARATVKKMPAQPQPPTQPPKPPAIWTEQIAPLKEPVAPVQPKSLITDPINAWSQPLSFTAVATEPEDPFLKIDDRFHPKHLPDDPEVNQDDMVLKPLNTPSQVPLRQYQAQMEKMHNFQDTLPEGFVIAKKTPGVSYRNMADSPTFRAICLEDTLSPPTHLQSKTLLQEAQRPLVQTPTKVMNIVHVPMPHPSLMVVPPYKASSDKVVPNGPDGPTTAACVVAQIPPRPRPVTLTFGETIADDKWAPTSPTDDIQDSDLWRFLQQRYAAQIARAVNGQPVDPRIKDAAIKMGLMKPNRSSRMAASIPIDNTPVLDPAAPTLKDATPVPRAATPLPPPPGRLSSAASTSFMKLDSVAVPMNVAEEHTM